MAEILVDFEGRLWEARRRLAERARCDLVLNLDADNILPQGYLKAAMDIFERLPNVGAVALMYVAPYDHGHLGFGTSLIPRELMLKYYDYRGGAVCECRYMWNKLEAQGFQVVTVKGMVARYAK